MPNFHVVLTFREPLLGTVPKNQDIYRDFVAKKAPKAEDAEQEIQTVEEIEESGWTGFHSLNGTPILYDYVIKGFFKDACSMLRRVPGTLSKDLSAFKKVIDGLVFVSPRMIPIDLKGQSLGVLERPLRAQTPQGERVALARSDYAPAGAVIEFDINFMGGTKGSPEKMLKEWLDYGIFRGLGQWRNASYGSFEYEMTKTG